MWLTCWIKKTGYAEGKPHWGHPRRLELIRDTMFCPTKSVRTKLNKFSNPSTSHVLQITDKTPHVTRNVMG